MHTEASGCGHGPEYPLCANRNRGSGWRHCELAETVPVTAQLGVSRCRNEVAIVDYARWQATPLKPTPERSIGHGHQNAMRLGSYSNRTRVRTALWPNQL